MTRLTLPSPLRTLLPLALFALALGVATLPAAASPAPAPAPVPQEADESPDDAQTQKAETGDTGEETLTRKERRQRAKQKRIEEYLAKKEARRAAREARRHREAMEEAEAAERSMMEEEGLIEEAPRSKPAPASRLPRRLARVQETVRESKIADDPTVQEYLDRIDRQMASPQQLAAFGNFIAENGLIEQALEYYRVAVGIERRDPVLWLNQGTLLRQLGDPKAAASSFARALSIDANNAAAHYNLGAALDELGKYEDALEEYKIALRLDPSLGDPAVNPQAANNDRLTAVKLMLYREQGGATTLPLASVPGGRLEEEPAER